MAIPTAVRLLGRSIAVCGARGGVYLKIWRKPSMSTNVVTSVNLVTCSKTL